MIFLDNTSDNRINSISVLAKMKASEYLNLIGKAYKNRGGIEGQRDPLRSKSAMRIRARMVNDIKQKGVIPPVVVGIRLAQDKYETLKICNTDSLQSFIDGLGDNALSVIDGMQRTTALLEVEEETLQDYDVRVEFWISTSSNSLVYRMLVLNTGQIPWALKRQLNVVFAQIKQELQEKIPDLQLIDTDDHQRRKVAGQYQANDVIELFLLFGTKRVSTDLQAELAEEFSRLDLVDSTRNVDFMETFIMVMNMLIKFDKAFSNLDKDLSGIELGKFKDGFSVFSKQPARAGFVAAAAQYIYGIPGMQNTHEQQQERRESYFATMNRIADAIPTEQQALSDFIDLSTLDERLGKRTTGIGEYYRNFFLAAFKTLIEESKDASLQTMTPCWVKY